MAAGKTSVGTQIAARTNRRFVDLDAAIAADGSAEPVAAHVARDEPDFRRREARALATSTPSKSSRYFCNGS